MFLIYSDGVPYANSNTFAAGLELVIGELRDGACRCTISTVRGDAVRRVLGYTLGENKVLIKEEVY